MYAICRGDKEIVSILLKSGAKTEALDDRGNSPLILAINQGRPAIINIIKKKSIIPENFHEHKLLKIYLKIETCWYNKNSLLTLKNKIDQILSDWPKLISQS
jgi:ankyrin repeat protein